MTQFEKLLKHIEGRLATAGLTLSEHGISGVHERFTKKESEGGYSTYWHNL